MDCPSDQQLNNYVGHCPSCGTRLRFEKMGHYGDIRASQGCCLNPNCGRRWSFTFDIDPSGTFGVVSFQCDNEDRIME